MQVYVKVAVALTVTVVTGIVFAPFAATYGHSFTFKSNTHNTKASPEFLRFLAKRDKLQSETDTALKTNRYKDAEASARQWVALDHRDKSGWYFLAISLDGQNREAEACDAYAELLRDDPHSSSSRQLEPRVLMRYAVLCFHTNRWQAGEAAAREAVAQMQIREKDLIRKIPSLPDGDLCSSVNQVEAMSHILSGKYQIDFGDSRQGMREFDAAIGATSDDAIIAAAYFEKYQSHGVLGIVEPERVAYHRAEGMKAIRQVAVHDAANGFYMDYVEEHLLPTQVKVNYGSTPDRTFSQ